MAIKQDNPRLAICFGGGRVGGMVVFEAIWANDIGVSVAILNLRFGPCYGLFPLLLIVLCTLMDGIERLGVWRLFLMSLFMCLSQPSTIMLQVGNTIGYRLFTIVIFVLIIFCLHS